MFAGIIDAHQHIWEMSRFAYTWLTPDKTPLYRDYLPAELWPQMELSGVRGGVLVQADNSVAESAWLLELASTNPRIAGVVGWIDLAAVDCAQTLESLSQNPVFKGVRPTLPGLEADWGGFAAGLGRLEQFNLSCDLLAKPAYYPRLYNLIASTGGVRFILDHFAGAEISPDRAKLKQWRRGLKPLAALPDVAMKLSGYFSTPGRGAVSPGQLRPYFEVALELFGPQRLMFGSDYPVCRRGGSYAEVVRVMSELIEPLSTGEQAAIWGQTARRVYRL